MPFFAVPCGCLCSPGPHFFVRAAHPAQRPRVTPPWPCANLPRMDAGSNAMRAIRLLCACAALLMAAAAPAPAQNRSQPPALAAPYKPVMITPPKPMTDESFEAMRKQLGEAAQRKYRAAMAGLVVAQEFFWQRENRNAAEADDRRELRRHAQAARRSRPAQGSRMASKLSSVI